MMAGGGAMAAAGLGGGAAAADTPFALPQPSVPISGGGRFPVRRIYCIGRNYAEHAKEMGSDPKTEPPFFFQKPSDAVQPVAEGSTGEHAYPPLTQNYHHELELVVFLKSGGRDIAAADALEHVYGYAVGLDMTRRDLQQKMKDGRKPWEIGKSFDHAAPVGPLMPVAAVGHLAKGTIELRVNGAVRQTDDLSAMIWSVPEQIAELSKGSELKAGDVIFTGTPAGVGPVVRGDVLEGRIAGLPDLRVKIV
jgi:2-keto-4-pentenoate hydratase/2-oxohepta-3-ene-1,7-dioic acid hydratase in catechol pathway